jgi:hypothetical protein
VATSELSQELCYGVRCSVLALCGAQRGVSCVLVRFAHSLTFSTCSQENARAPKHMHALLLWTIIYGGCLNTSAPLNCYIIRVYMPLRVRAAYYMYTIAVLG